MLVTCGGPFIEGRGLPRQRAALRPRRRDPAPVLGIVAAPIHHHLPRARRPVARHHRRRRPARGRRARLRERPRRHVRLRHLGRATSRSCEWIAEHQGSSPTRSSPPTARCRRTPSSSSCSSSPATWSSSRRPPTTARCCRCASSAPSCSPSRSRTTASTSRRSPRRSRPARGRSSPTSFPTSTTPAGCTLSLEKRQRLLELAEEHDFVVFEDDPYVELRFEGEALPTMLSLDDAGQGGLRVVVLEDGLPGHPRGLPGRPARR